MNNPLISALIPYDEEILNKENICIPKILCRICEDTIPADKMLVNLSIIIKI